ncbi:MAG: MiaB/RimO family radical SAM methylthiotransferase, partial [Pseudomonadota bacterium]
MFVYSGSYFIETYGCQMNEHDSEKMSALLETMGFVPAESPAVADVVIINTCSIREKAEHKVYTALGKLKPLKAVKPHLVTIVAGCVAQQEKTSLLKRAPHLDAVVGTHCIGEIPRIVKQVLEAGERVEATWFGDDPASLQLSAPRKGRSSVCSYVTVMQGCSNFCSYCVVPFTRGREVSRPLSSVVKEIEGLVAGGVREVTLLGQNVNAYGNDLPAGSSFAGLLEAISAIPGLSRIRFTTSHPKDFGPDLAHAMAELPPVCEHVHL